MGCPVHVHRSAVSATAGEAAPVSTGSVGASTVRREFLPAPPPPVRLRSTSAAPWREGPKTAPSPPCLCGLRDTVSNVNAELASPHILLQRHVLYAGGEVQCLTALRRALAACEQRHAGLKRDLAAVRQRLVSAALAATKLPGGEAVYVGRCPACDCELDDLLCAAALCPYQQGSAAAPATSAPSLTPLPSLDSFSSGQPDPSRHLAAAFARAVFGSNSSQPSLAPILDTAVQLLKLHPLDAAPIITIISDCVTGLPESAEYDSVLMQLVRHDTNVAVIQLGSCSGVHSSLGSPPDRDGAKYVTDCTGGFRCRYKDLVAWSGVDSGTDGRVALTGDESCYIRGSPRSEWNVSSSAGSHDLVEVGGDRSGCDAPPFSLELWTPLQRRLLVRPSVHRLRPARETIGGAASATERSFIDEALVEFLPAQQGRDATAVATGDANTAAIARGAAIDLLGPSKGGDSASAVSQPLWRLAPSWGGGRDAGAAPGGTEPLSSTYNFRKLKREWFLCLPAMR